MATKTLSDKIGSDFQKKVREALQSLQTKEGLFFHRFADSKAAGNFLPAQPGDFLAALGGRCVLLETKASEKHTSLSLCWRSAIDEGQIGHHLLWNKAGMESYFVFYSDLTAEVEAWAGERVVRYWRRNQWQDPNPDASFIVDDLEDMLMELV